MKLIASATGEPAVTTPDGGQRRVLSFGDGIMLVQFTFDAGLTSTRHSHPHQQVGYVVSGEIDFLLEGYPAVRLGAGGSYYVPSNLPHHIITYAPTVIVDAFAPMRQDFLETGQGKQDK